MFMRQILLGNHQSLEVSSINLSIINFELCESVINFGGGELVAEGHQLGSEGLGVDLAVLLESLEGSEDDIVIIGSTSHLGSEKGDHLGEVHGSINLIEHCLQKWNLLRQLYDNDENL